MCRSGPVLSTEQLSVRPERASLPYPRLQDSSTGPWVAEHVSNPRWRHAALLIILSLTTLQKQPNLAVRGSQAVSSTFQVSHSRRNTPLEYSSATHT